MDEFASQHVHAEFAISMAGQRWSVQCIHFKAHWVYCFGRRSRSRRRNSHGRARETWWKGLLVFSRRACTDRVAETLTAATGQKFTAEVLDAKSFLSVVAQPGSAFEPAYAKGGLELFSQVEDGRMAYVGS